ncbi:hypothetical protein [Amycolatopsis sp. NPDC051903]|uniref:hypothetical protein n=1 Tax=Amycolatopsis sp. NPDC051903 TaxID=3363936 RepID=UPI00379DE8BC
MNEATGLLEQVLQAHGGVDRWRRAGTIRARLYMAGPTLTALGQEKILAGVGVAVDVQRPRTVLTDFTGPGLRGVYTPHHVRLEDANGTVLAERTAPRESFPPRLGGVRWDALHVLYFAGYGLWNYLTNPYLLTWPCVRTEELGPGETDGPGWRRLRVTFPEDIATHSAEQVFHYDERGLQRRVDYAPYVLGSRPAAHHTEAHREVSGLVLPTHRYVLPVKDGVPQPEPIFVLDFTDVTVDEADQPQSVRGGRR